ncbi:hypothetical protein PG994_005744 [Apiospora phragmitis]|uniref:Uncharacterized protein n=1 Tax=Apiospora phragmitis TaxID=2905665 RepID=A0ABR1VD69_9PEZI
MPANDYEDFILFDDDGGSGNASNGTFRTPASSATGSLSESIDDYIPKYSTTGNVEMWLEQISAPERQYSYAGSISDYDETDSQGSSPRSLTSSTRELVNKWYDGIETGNEGICGSSSRPPKSEKRQINQGIQLPIQLSYKGDGPGTDFLDPETEPFPDFDPAFMG